MHDKTRATHGKSYFGSYGCQLQEPEPKSFLETILGCSQVVAPEAGSFSRETRILQSLEMPGLGLWFEWSPTAEILRLEIFECVSNVTPLSIYTVSLTYLG